ncbi:MAG: putative porin [Bacteroidota bacterium]
MILQRLALLLFILLVCPRWAEAQILDDTTKIIYGPHSTRYVLENDIFNNREISYTIDTLLDNFHKFNFKQRNQNLYQDLGNLGTAMRPVFYQPSEKIGAMLGFNAYAPYAFDPEQIKYYDTKSPYSSLYYVSGGNGVQLLDIEHSRSINNRWNIGFRYQRPTANKQFANLSQTDRQVDSHSFALYTRFKSKDSTYLFLGNFTHLNHSVSELGSILQLDEQGQLIPEKDLFDRSNQRAVLDKAGSQEVRNHIHFYQQYSPVGAFQLYHVFDRQQQRNYFVDGNLANSQLYHFYDTVFYNATRTEQETKYLLFENKVGIKGTFTKGRLNGFNYRFHARRRDYSLVSNFSGYHISRSENFVGGWLNYYLPDSSRFFVDVEYLLGGDYRARAEFQSKLLTGGYYRINSSPTLIQQEFFSNNYSWHNDFKNVSSDNIYGNLHVRIGGLTLQPSVLISNLKNYIYYDKNAHPQQYTSDIQIIRMGFGLQFRAGNFHTANQVYYTQNSNNDNIFRVPELFVNSRVAYNILFKKVLYIQLGVEMHYKSSYFADRYMPLTQQFYLQDKTPDPQRKYQQPFEVLGYLQADAFASFRVQRVRLFFQLSHANQGFMSQPGYFVAPVYTALSRSFGFGVNWMLFD